MHPDEGVTGELYMFWNFMECTGQPVLLALNAGIAAKSSEGMADEAIVKKSLDVLGKIFTPQRVTKLNKSHVTRWRAPKF